MLGLKVIASLLSLAEHISRCIWPSQRPGKKQSKSTKPNPPMDNARRGIRFYVNHPYQGRYDSINLVDAKSGLSLLFVIDGGSAYEVHQLVAAALRRHERRAADQAGK